MRIVVLGVGNILLSDEGLGVRAIERLPLSCSLPPEVELIDGGTSGMEIDDPRAVADHKNQPGGLLSVGTEVRSGSRFAVGQFHRCEYCQRANRLYRDLALGRANMECIGREYQDGGFLVVYNRRNILCENFVGNIAGI